ncbi:hypothetical protein [Cupriavidus nantongensis]|uniref:hypothetical protein n=1 Tax=Cupriavidus nantongensis TaxID=1796606 RepID=UPI00358E4355
MSTKNNNAVSAPNSLRDKESYKRIQAFLIPFKAVLNDSSRNPNERVEKLIALAEAFWPGDRTLGTQGGSVHWAANTIRDPASPHFGRAWDTLRRVYQDVEASLPSAHENLPGDPNTVMPKLSPVDRSFWVNYEG